MNKKLNNKDVVKIYKGLKRGKSVRSLSFKYEVTPSSIYRIAKGEHSAVIDKPPINLSRNRLTTSRILHIYKDLLNGSTVLFTAKKFDISYNTVLSIKNKQSHIDILRKLPEIGAEV